MQPAALSTVKNSLYAAMVLVAVSIVATGALVPLLATEDVSGGLIAGLVAVIAVQAVAAGVLYAGIQALRQTSRGRDDDSSG